MVYSLSIGQLARATGVPAKTIRYYEQVGILPSPRRSAAGYRQYTQRDVHRLLFIRRARVLGLSLPSIKTLIAELDGQCLSMRPRLKEVVTAHLNTVRQQVAEFQLLERQLAQILHRLLTLPPSDHTEGCHCLDVEASAEGTPQQSSPHRPGEEAMSTPSILESFTVLTTTEGSCGCGCDCGPLTQLTLPQSNTGQEERSTASEIRLGDDTRR